MVEHSIEHWRQEFFNYKIYILNCLHEIHGDLLLVVVVTILACCETVHVVSCLR